MTVNVTTIDVEGSPSSTQLRDGDPMAYIRERVARGLRGRFGAVPLVAAFVYYTRPGLLVSYDVQTSGRLIRRDSRSRPSSTCVACGLSVPLHFDRQNRMRSCEAVLRRHGKEATR